MKTSLHSFFVAALALLVSGASSGLAQVPGTMSYQGRVQVSGNPFTGTGQFKFALVDVGSNTVRQATATASVTGGFLTAINVVNGGSGYATPPAVSIADSTGSGAVAVAQVAGGSVVSITVQNAGSGYSAGPVVNVAPPPPNLAFRTFWSNDGTSAAGGEPTGGVPVAVAQGLFTILLGDTNLPNMLPIPAGAFANNGVHLRVWFNDGTQGFTQLGPDVPVASVGYALVAASVRNAGVTTSGLADGSVTSEKIADGSVELADLSSSAQANFWRTSGNSGTTPGAHFLGTTDDRALELRVNGARALRLEPTATAGAVNVIGATAVESTISGGVLNMIEGGGFQSIISGGSGNTIQGAARATISGGWKNLIGPSGSYATIPGGVENQALGLYSYAAGYLARARHPGSFVWADSTGVEFGSTANNQFLIRAAGGVGIGTTNPVAPLHLRGTGQTMAVIDSSHTMGTWLGINNSAGGFRWSIISSGSGNGEGAGRLLFFTSQANDTKMRLEPNGNLIIDGVLTELSDRNRKENAESVTPSDVLEKVLALPLRTWNYRDDETKARHLGPMAQDFSAAFGLGSDERHIATLDVSGVALAAVQGLNEKLEAQTSEKDAEIRELKQTVEELKEMLHVLVEQKGGAR